MDTYALLFLGAFIAWVLLGILYSIDVEEPRPARKVLVIRGRIRVTHVPHALHASTDVAPFSTFYEGCYQSLINALSKEAKDNL